jgi:hypothetical protein
MDRFDKDDTPITLKEACELYGNRFKVSTLRAEAGRGKLRLFRLGRRDYTSPAFLREWIKRCQDDAAEQRGFTSTRQPRLSEKQQHAAASERLKETVQMLRRRPR